MKIALLGYGKMGQAIEKLALEQKHEICLTIDNDNDWHQKQEDLKNADVAIEFSIPSIAPDNIKKCLNANIPVVVGTTGWYAQLEEIKNLCDEKKGCLFYASNFSIGANIFFEINRLLAKLMNPHPEYGISIDEIHHIHKLDSPSGTAICLAQDIINRVDRKEYWVNHETEKPSELEINSLRTANVPGVHIVNYHSANDTIEIKHTAHNRLGLATGALLAAEFVIGKTGIFTMNDLLQLQ